MNEKKELPNLTEEQIEALAFVIENAGDVVTAATKILRHGMTSYNPLVKNSCSNRNALEKALGGVWGAHDLICAIEAEDDSRIRFSAIIHWAAEKKRTAGPYLHHSKFRTQDTKTYTINADVVLVVTNESITFLRNSVVHNLGYFHNSRSIKAGDTDVAIQVGARDFDDYMAVQNILSYPHSRGKQAHEIDQRWWSEIDVIVSKKNQYFVHVQYKGTDYALPAGAVRFLTSYPVESISDPTVFRRIAVDYDYARNIGLVAPQPDGYPEDACPAPVTYVPVMFKRTFPPSIFHMAVLTEDGRTLSIPLSELKDRAAYAVGTNVVIEILYTTAAQYRLNKHVPNRK